ncbi:MAG: response regulator [Gammaproteobacteria bacterium]|nr:response regulator [Gammaproteobacteria bacterium]
MRILLAEDDPAQADALYTVLSLEYHIELAKDGESAWQMHRYAPFDLLLLDVQMPLLDGIAFCRRLRVAGDQTPVLLLTADTTDKTRIQGLNNGADDYINKPALAAELLARVRNLLRRGRVATSNVLTYGALQLDYIAHTARYSNHTLNLTPKEFALLEWFLVNPVRVFSRTQLVAALWSSESDVLEDTVKAHIKGVRNKLREAGAPELLLNVRGVGYKLAENTGAEPPSFLPMERIQERLQFLWETYQPLMNQRIGKIEGAFDAVQRGELTEESRLTARQHAHNLAGSLGLFSRNDVTAAVRRVEQFFLSESINPGSEEIQKDIVAIRQVIENPIPTTEIGNAAVPRTTDAKVLAVDDDPVFLESIKLLLTREGMNVETLNDSSGIIPFLEKINPELLLLDYMMPGWDGIAICKSLRADPHWKHLPIIFITATHDSAVIARIFDAMADDYISKPLHPGEFGTRVSNRLRHIRAKT